MASRAAGSRSSSGGPSSASNSGPPSPGGGQNVWDLSIFKVPKPKACIFWCNHCPPSLRRFLIWLWIFVGLAASITACILIIHDLKVNRQKDLELECLNRANVLQSELRAAGDQALMYSGFVLTLQENLTQANFQRFGETTLAGRYLLGRIAYLIRVTNEQRPLYDNASFPFTQYAPNSTTIQVPRGNATEYAPVRYTAQVPLRSNIFGLDVSADPAIQATIFAARDTGVEQLSAPRTLYNGLRGFVIVFPVFEPPDLPANATVQARRDACVGYIYAQVNVQSLATNVFGTFTNKKVESRLYDVTTTKEPSFDNILYAPQFIPDNSTGSTFLDAGTNLTASNLPPWKADFAVILHEQNRNYAVQCRRAEPNNTKIALTGVGYAILVMFVVLMAALTMRVSFKRLDSMEKEAARMQTVSERLSMAKAAAEAADTAKGRFLATVSHEIRTPLNGVLGCMSLLLDTPLNDVQLDYVRTARASGKALVALVNDVLDLSKVEAGAMELECEPFDIRSLIEDVLGMFASTTREKGLELAGLVRDGVPETVVGDAGRIRQVLINLLGNAVKFTQKGSIFVCVWAASVPKRSDQSGESERVGPAVTWVSKPDLEATGEGGGATLRRPKLPFGSPSILVESEAGTLRPVGGSFREDEGRKISKGSVFGSLRLGRSGRFTEPRAAEPRELSPPGSILKSGGAPGNSARFKHVTINIPDPAGDDPVAPEREEPRRETDPPRTGSFSQKLKLTLSGLARAKLLRKGGEHEEGATDGPEKQATPAARSEEGEASRSWARRRSFEIYTGGLGRSNSMRRDVELGSLKEVPEKHLLLDEEKEGRPREGGESGPKALAASTSLPLPGEELEQRIFFRVEDTGPGVAPSVQNRLFRPFQQADSSTSRKFGGTGIGLVISERLVSLMGGSMVAWSEMETGTSFQFDIQMPAVDFTPPTPSSGGQSPIANESRHSSPTAPSELEGARAIVVQDEEIRREVAASILQRMQMHVVGVCNCSEALELALAAHAHEADRATRGISPEPSPRGFRVLRRKLSRSGISSTPGTANNLRNGQEQQEAETSGVMDGGPPSRTGSLDTATKLEELAKRSQEGDVAQPSESGLPNGLRGPAGETGSASTSEGSWGLAPGSATAGALPAGEAPTHQRLDSKSSSTSSGSNTSTLAEQGRLPSLRLWNMAEGDGEDKDMEAVITQGEKALQTAGQKGGGDTWPQAGADPQSLDINPVVNLQGSGVDLRAPPANPDGLGADPQGSGANPQAQEIEQVSLSGSGETPESSTPSFSDTKDAHSDAMVLREPFGRAPLDSVATADVTQNKETKLALQDAAMGGRFRLVLVDMDCTGKVAALEFARQVRDDPRLKDLLVVSMCVGAQEMQAGKEAEQVGLLGPVFKPLRRGALAAILHTAMHPEGGQLPRSPPGEETTQSATSPPVGKPRLDGRKVLVVDDVAINVKVASRMLAALKCDVLTASSGQEAIDIFRREGGELELILMDVQMPEMDGFEATQKIREIMQESEAQGAPKRKLPILALTADVMSGTKEECLKAGMDGYLPKPLNPKKLKELLYEFLGSD